METNNQLVTGSFQYQPFAILPQVLQARDTALAASALIGKVETTAQNEASAAARRTIKQLLSLFETQRQKLKTPILEAGRQLDRVVDAEREELKREDGRLEQLEREFMRAEMRRREEELELQRRELQRIEEAKQAQLLRIAREQAAAEAAAAAKQAEIDRQAREAAEAAARLAAEATNKKQREAAEAARLAAEQQAREAEAARQEQQRQAALAAETARQQAQLVTEHAATASYLESKPPEISRAKGQSVKKVWLIDQINDHVLYKSCPDLVTKFQWDLVGLKERLAERDGKIPGVTAHEDIKVGSRGGRSPSLIEI